MSVKIKDKQHLLQISENKLQREIYSKSIITGSCKMFVLRLNPLITVKAVLIIS